MRPFITVEPKFNNNDVLIELLKEMQSGEYLPPDHLAIIVRNHEQLALVESFVIGSALSEDAPKIAVALAFRSNLR